MNGYKAVNKMNQPKIDKLFRLCEEYDDFKRRGVSHNMLKQYKLINHAYSDLPIYEMNALNEFLGKKDEG